MPFAPQKPRFRRPTPRRIAAFRRFIWKHFARAARDLPWRRTHDPYRILVSEVMLQQTQAERVLPKYEAFLTAFPTAAALARASSREVLALWQGLGYNRRALALKRAAEEIVKRGEFPRTPEELEALPGVGPYTARAVLSFAFGEAHPFIETNIRTVYIHEFFKRKKSVSDREILPVVEATLSRKRVREWYFALMDYGVKLKRAGASNMQSAHYARQAPFKGSRRELRGKLLAFLVREGRSPLEVLERRFPDRTGELAGVLRDMEKEGFVRVSERGVVSLA